MTMGGGPELKPQHERVLVALPGPEPTALLDRIRENYSHVDVEFVQLGNSHDSEVPSGKGLSFLSYFFDWEGGAQGQFPDWAGCV